MKQRSADECEVADVLAEHWLMKPDYIEGALARSTGRYPKNCVCTAQ
jgi:hypothetical protein